ncbi:hypothetical protein P9112_007857 [Eukaryota sp. TZLM1-RC]
MGHSLRSTHQHLQRTPFLNGASREIRELTTPGYLTFYSNVYQHSNPTNIEINRLGKHIKQSFAQVGSDNIGMDLPGNFYNRLIAFEYEGCNEDFIAHVSDGFESSEGGRFPLQHASEKEKLRSKFFKLVVNEDDYRIDSIHNQDKMPQIHETQEIKNVLIFNSSGFLITLIGDTLQPVPFKSTSS